MIGLWNALLFFTLIEVKLIHGKLSGDHICVTEKTFLVNSTEFYIKNLTIRQYKWCFNYPPRCSFYTINKVNASRVIEKNETRSVEECCPGFIEYQNECVTPCINCNHGICENGTCTCLTGFKGEHCDQECGFNEWGPNCSKACDCNNNSCDYMTGLCITNSTNMITTEESPVTDVQNNIPQVTHVVTKLNEIAEVKTIKFTPNEAVTSVYSLTNNPEIVIDKNEFRSPTTESIFNTNLTNGIKLNGTSSTDIANLKNTTKHSSKQMNQLLEKQFPAENIFPIKTFPNGTIATKVGLLIPVEIQYGKLQTASSNETRLFGNEEYLNRTNDYPSKDVILFTIAIIAIFVGVLAILSINIMKKRKLNQTLQHENNQVAVFSTSIFHSPLPAVREYEYDHPVSSAASVFKPIELKDHQNIEQSSEPIYDEIPYKEFEQSSKDTNSAIYVNTLGRTKL
ncbi:uncharacterized protein LOC130903635 [Diorhabda carinulata]|uniref:uncharacterized protein LOC130903635 n=1 Tax=Diorhabda carinulata TaxID=1163345 RepID=UPI0025A0AE99|nr:uncharacterized protein LOC130903635 [Diorhabda carinulata]